MKNDVYGRRIIENICKRGFAHWVHWVHEFEPPTADLLDNPEKYLPKSMPECNLILSLGLLSDLQFNLPIIAKKTKTKAVIAPIDNPNWIRPGLRKQIHRELAEVGVASTFPKPFCSLEETGNLYIDKFAEHFGRPRLEIEINRGLFSTVQVKRGAPCGSTWFIAEKLIGLEISQQRVRDEVAKAHHAYPCLASMVSDAELGDTILHKSQYIIREAVEKKRRLETDDELETFN
ncbi:MAG: thymidylate synthase [Candidatus Bathyarchaeota archaeon]|nr:MAG: thymidylate synthase [Candidatus Bathyarchaeota archaeon]